MDSIVDKMVDRLHHKNIILYPTDTIWWIWWDATDEWLIERVIRIKQRDSDKKWLVVLMHPSFIEHYVECDLDQLLEKYMQLVTPTTFLFDAHRGLPTTISTNTALAVRIPFMCSYLMKVLEWFWKPIISTSANISHHPYPTSFGEISKEIFQWVDYVLPDDTHTGTWEPSSILSYADSTQWR